jgi:hypothetical protein
MRLFWLQRPACLLELKFSQHAVEHQIGLQPLCIARKQLSFL